MADDANPHEVALPARVSHSRGGFTLLEVLAAVAILAIWYVVLAAMTTDGLRRLGTSNRLLEASQIADRVISEIEATTLDGSAPEGRNEKTEEGDFNVTVFIVPFGYGGDPGAAAGSGSKTADLATLLKQEMPGFARHLVAVNVSVSWEEGLSTEFLRRTTYAFNRIEAAKAYKSQQAKDAAEEESLEEENGEDDLDDDEEEEF